MLLYHGTPNIFSEPSLAKCKPHRDFGCGFYLAPNFQDALPLAIKHSHIGYVYTYVFKDADDLNVIILDGYSDEWLELVVKARMGFPPNADLVIGNTAGGGVNLKDKFTKLRNGNATTEEAINLMRDELTNAGLGVQYCFLTPKALRKLKKINEEVYEREAAR